MGDYTETLKLLTPKARVEVEGPFGRFSYVFEKNKKQVWIAGGIGITPFMSMAASFPHANMLDVTLIYSVKAKAEAVFDRELRDLSQRLNFKYILYESESQGRLTSKFVDTVVDNLSVASCFICGPAPMMTSLKKQLVSKGVRQGRIHTEEFALD